MAPLVQNALGYFIQLYPCALMIFLPFPEEAHHFRRRTILIWAAVVSVVMAVLFSTFLCLRDMEKYPSHVPITNLFMLAGMLLLLAAYIWLVREPVLKKLLTFAVVTFYGVTVFALVNMLGPFFETDNFTRYAYDKSYLLLYAGVTAVMLPLMLAVVIRPLGEYLQLIETKNMRWEFGIIIFTTLFYFALEYVCSTIYGNNNGFGGEWGALQYQFLVLLLMMLYQIAIYWLVFRESVRRKRDSERQRSLEIQKLQYEKIVGDMETTRRMRHDLRHHYNSLSEMLAAGKLDEMREYLSEVTASAMRMNDVYCRNMAVNGLLQYYAGLARDEGIRCDIHADCEDLPVEPADLTVLFGNALENAVNACRKFPGDRWISVQVGTVQSSLAIEISNSCQGVRLDRRYQSAEGFSPAEAFLSGRNGGGYGLRSISHTARKYGGSAQFRFNAEKRMFTTRIRLNLHADM